MAFDGYTNLVTAAQNGQITIEMSPEGFDKIDKVLGNFMDGIDELRRVVDELAAFDDYGLGDKGPGATSAPALVAKLKGKVQGGPDSALDTLKAYSEAANQLRLMFQASRRQYVGTDNQAAANLFAALDKPEQP